MAYSPRPHVSAALSHLRLGVTASAVVVGAALALNILVWAFAHFTDVRETVIESGTSESQPLEVVQGDPDAVTLAQRRAAMQAERAQRAEAEGQRPADVNRVVSRFEPVLSRLSGLARVFGMIAGLVMAVLMLEAVVIAGGASVPGVERAVTAASWALVIGLLCAPLDRIAPSLGFPGALAPYETIVSATDAVRAGRADAPGAVMIYGLFFLLPLATIVATALVVIRFHSGVERGAIVTSVSELDDQVAREMSSIKVGATNAPRTVGALNRAIGDRSAAQPAPAMAGAASEDGGGEGPALREPSPGAGLRRPI